MFRSSIVFLALIAVCYAGLTSHVTVEPPAQIPAGWNLVSTLSAVQTRASAARVSFRLALKQRNLDKLEKLFWEVSNPDHENYGKYLSREEVDVMLSPAADMVKKVTQWLASVGLEAEDHGDWLHIRDAPLDKVRVLFSTNFAVVMDPKGTPLIRAVGGLRVPSDVAQVVELVTGLTEMRNKVHYVHKVKIPQPNQGVVIPQTVWNLYRTNGASISTNSSQCVAEFSDDTSWSQSDMKAFVKGCDLNSPNKVTIKGPYDPSSPDGEATLDIQYVTAVGRNGTNWYYTLKDWLLEFAQDLSALSSPPLVNSMSWGSDERAEGTVYNGRVDNEFKKLGVRGVTMTAASGDSGAVGTAQCTGNSHQFNPGYPAASSYVLAVGATMLEAKGQNVQAPSKLPPVCSNLGLSKCILNGTEVPADIPDGSVGDGFATGGGFSVFNPTPSYQTSAVAAYINDNSIPKPPARFFNASHRGFPDVGAIGNQLAIYLQGGWQLVGGTSASSPIIAGVIALMNDHLFKNGKPSVGFANPLIYKMAREAPDTFRSIGDLGTNNKNGCKYGYVSNPHGWDPVTGLGVPNYPAIISYLNQLHGI